MSRRKYNDEYGRVQGPMSAIPTRSAPKLVRSETPRHVLPTSNLMERLHSVPSTPQRAEPYAPATPQSLSAMFQAEGSPTNDWITVFGFHPSMATRVLAHFDAYGNIVQKIHPPDCNWMYLRYESVRMALKALGKHGKNIEWNIMVGVVPMSHRDVENLERERAPQSLPPIGKEHVLSNDKLALDAPYVYRGFWYHIYHYFFDDAVPITN